MRVITKFILWNLGLAKAETQTSDAERDCLARYAAEKKCLVEIGVWQGVTTCRLRAAMSAAGVIYGIDPYPKGRLGFSTHQVIAHKEVAKIPRGNIQWVRKTGAEAAREYAQAGGKRVDFVFIDGVHTYAGLKEDWEAWNPLVAPQGIVALHDSRSSSERFIEDAGSVIFTREVIMCDPRFEVVETVDTLTILQKRPEP